MPNDEAGSDRLKALLEKLDPAVVQRVMPLTGGVITMMFTDIVGSTKIKAEVGDERYFSRILTPHNQLVRECVARHNGRELKMMGDAFLVGFTVPSEAVVCVCEIQQRLTTSPVPAGQSALQVRIGLHTGTPIVYRDPVSGLVDLSGTDVDKAARVQPLAGGGQVLISEETRVLAKPQMVHDWGPWDLKGLGRHRIFEVLLARQGAGATVGSPVADCRALSHKLHWA
ncbi:MAG: adenylate/guanylate cyclase domain-containing protein [Armatimonadetes bacterium]|nr:adenylate/guanylate cyclase domain-containing protein [Armatimonadota bacterium]